MHWIILFKTVKNVMPAIPVIISAKELRKYNDIKNLPCRFPPQTYVSTLSSVSSQPCHLYTYPSD